MQQLHPDIRRIDSVLTTHLSIAEPTTQSYVKPSTISDLTKNITRKVRLIVPYCLIASSCEANGSAAVAHRDQSICIMKTVQLYHVIRSIM